MWHWVHSILFKFSFVAIITNPSFPIILVLCGCGVFLALETLPHYFCGSLACGSRSLTVFFLDQPSKFSLVTKGAKKFSLLCT